MKELCHAWINSYIKWIMLVCGLLTCTMVYAVIDPQGALMNTFGATLEGPLVNIVVRNWGALITLVGALLVYGQAYLGTAGVAVVFDLLAVALFIIHLVQLQRQPVSA